MTADQYKTHEPLHYWRIRCACGETTVNGCGARSRSDCGLRQMECKRCGVIGHREQTTTPAGIVTTYRCLEHGWIHLQGRNV